MKFHNILVFFVLMLSYPTYGQERKYSTFYYQRATLFEELSIGKKDIVFLGNSITNGAEWFELFNNARVKNRGISGDTCEGVYDRLDSIVKGQPCKVFLLIGINDLNIGRSPKFVEEGIYRIIKKIHKDSPKTDVYVQSILPVTDEYGKFSGHTSKGNLILEINHTLSEHASAYNYTYIDLHSSFVNPDTGKMRSEYTNDGLHLLGVGYKRWVEIIKPYM